MIATTHSPSESPRHPPYYGVANLADAVSALLDPDQRSIHGPLLICGVRVATLRQAQDAILAPDNGRQPKPEAVADLCATFRARLGVEIPKQNLTWPEYSLT